MPTYEYVCTECGAPLEVVQSIHDPALTECPACAGRLRKVFGNVGVVFKGSGFYRTDSRGKSSGSAPAAAKAPGAAAGGTTGDAGGSTSGSSPSSASGGSGSASGGSGSASAGSGSGSASTGTPAAAAS